MVTLTRPEGSRPLDFARTRRGLAGVFFASYALAAFPADAEPIHTDAEGLVTDTVAIPVGGASMPAFLARPAAPGRYGALLVVSEIFGIHEYIRDICRRLAKLGYVAIAPAFFFRAGDPAPLTDFAQIMPIVAKATYPQVQGDVGSTLAWLQNQPPQSRPSMTDARTSAARAQSRVPTSRWVVTRTVRAAKALTRIPCSLARATIVAASGAGSRL